MSPEQLYFENEALVEFALKKIYKKRSPMKADLLQEGRLALWKAALTFDPSRNIRFSTYACSILFRKLSSYVHQQTYDIRPPVRNDYSWKDFNWLKDHLLQGGCPNKIPEEKNRRSLSKELRDKLDEAKECLNWIPGRDGEVARLHYLELKTYEEISQIYGISRKRVGDLIYRALNELGHKYMMDNFDWCFCYNCRKETVK